ncbi:MAG: tetratricopeptide repeat protein [Alphaproteobacteria bacterium]
MPQAARAAPDPAGDPSALFHAVLELRGAGRHADAIALCEALVKRAPRHAEAWHVLGILRFEAGHPGEALRPIERAIGLAPKCAAFHNSLGIVRRALREPKRAAQAFRRALSLDPDMPEAHNGLGAVLLDAGDRAGAIAAFRAALGLETGYADAALNLTRALAQDTNGHDEAFALLKGLSAHLGLGHHAIEEIVALGARLDTGCLPPWLGGMVAAWLEGGVPVSAVLEALAWRLVLARTPEADAAAGDPLTRAVLARCLAVTPEAGRLVEGLTRRALDVAASGRPLVADELAWVVALVFQAILSGHVLAAPPDEAGIVAGLRAAIERSLAADEVPPADSLALYAVFAPLHELAGAERLAALPRERWPDRMRPLIERALIEPFEERALQPCIPSLGALDDEVSRKIGAQYEAHPYPRWVATELGPKRPLGAILRDHLPAGDVPRRLDGGFDMLVAGCGTGWSVVHDAVTYAGARVVGLDLSRASLAYCLREVARRRLDNVSLVHGDILNLDRLGRSFDYIVCGGVLHHMADPLAGWRALLGCLAPDGLLYVGLYSELGRRAVVAARELIREQGIAASDNAIRAFRRLVLEQPADSPLAPLMRFTDFYYLSGCRDLMFNEMEHRFDLNLLEAALDRLGLEFLGFHHPSAGPARLYAERFPDDPAMRRLANWHLLESERPDLFAAMYQFWCRRKPVR